MAHSVIVVGLPRSGTSLMAGIFARKGFFVAPDPESDLRSGDDDNPGGYWEAGGLIDRNVEVFEAAGYPYHNTWMFEPISREAAERISGLSALPGHVEFVEAYERHAPWLWKDPRLCYTLGYWWRLVNPDTTRVVVIRRDPKAIYQSFVRVKWRDRSRAARRDTLTRIDRHLVAASESIRSLGIPHEVIEYEDFRAAPSEVAQRLGDLLDLPLEVADLHFDERLDRSTMRGRLATRLDRAVEYIPGGVRRAAKRLAPKGMMRFLFPERFEG